MGPLQRFPWLWRHRILLLLIFLPVAGLAVCEIAGWPFLRPPAERLMSQRMERPVRITAPFRLHFLGSLRLQAHGLWIAAPSGFDLPHFLDAQDIALKLRYRDLRDFRHTKRLHIAALDVSRMDARLVRRSNGDATWRFGPPDPNKPAPEPPAVDILAIRQGTLTFRDPTLETDLQASFDTRAGDGEAAPVSHVQAQGVLRQRPFTGELTTLGWLPAAFEESTAGAVKARGWLTSGSLRADFDGSVKDLLGRRGIHGTVTAKGPSLGLLGQLVGSPLPTTAPFSVRGSIDKEQDTWSARVDQAEIGRSRLAAHFTYDPATKPPQLKGELSGASLYLADLAPAFGTRTVEGQPIRRQPGHLFPNRPLNLPALKNLTARVVVNLDRVDLGSAFKEPITPFKAVLTLAQGKLGLAKVDARAAGGRLTGDISVDAREKTPLWRSDLAWDGIRLEDWLKGAKTRGKGTPAAAGEKRPPYFTGTLLGRAKVVGEGRSTAEVLGSLDGDITLFVRNGTLSRLVVELLGLDVAQSLGLVLEGDQTLPVRCAVMDLQARHGVLSPKVALIDTPVTLVLADGTIDLAKESLNFRLTAKPKNVSPFTVRSPIRIRGALDAPDVAPEPGPIAARVVGGLALAFVNPLAAIIPFVDPGGTSGSHCAEALASLKR
ncbi:MAG: asmA [Rhodocyclaceae bacterium]|nr:asmA [Rhodocyclaceae bacterium]